MLDGVKRDATHHACCLVTKVGGRPRVCKFVEGEGEDQRHKFKEDECGFLAHAALASVASYSPSSCERLSTDHFGFLYSLIQQLLKLLCGGGCNWGLPDNANVAERLGDEEAVPAFQRPRAFWM